MATAASAPAESARHVWISARMACEVLGTHRAKLVGLADEGKVRRRALPGCHPRYSLGDVQRLAGESMAS